MRACVRAADQQVAGLPGHDQLFVRGNHPRRYPTALAADPRTVRGIGCGVKFQAQPRKTPAYALADRRRTIQSALGAPFAQQGLRVEYTTYVLRGNSGDSQRVILSVGAELPLGTASSGAADVVFAATVLAVAKAELIVSSLSATTARPWKV